MEKEYGLSKLTTGEKNRIKTYAISLANAASDYELLSIKNPEMRGKLFQNYTESKKALFDYVNSL